MQYTNKYRKNMEPRQHDSTVYAQQNEESQWSEFHYSKQTEKFTTSKNQGINTCKPLLCYCN